MKWCFPNPISHPSLIKNERSLTILVTAFEITLGHLTSPEYENYAWLSFGLIITFVICGCNISIWRKFQNAELTFQAQNRAARYRRLTKTLLFVSVLALLSWLPLIIMDALEVIFEVTIPAGNFLLRSNPSELFELFSQSSCVWIKNIRV